MIIKYILPLIALSIVIAIHELGHLIIAKIFKVKVEVYSIGIGKKLLKKTVGQTEYAISLIPLGGYCKLKGGDLNQPNLDFDSMDSIHPLKKVLIFFAGPFFNLLLSIFFMTLVFMLPINQVIEPFIQPVIGQNLPAEEYGLLKGDLILSIDNKNIKTFTDISKYLNNEKINIKILRNEEILTLDVYPKNIDGNNILGIYPFIPLTIVQKNSVSDLIKGDKIIKVDNIVVNDYISLQKLIDKKDNFSVTILRDQKELIYNLNKSDLTNISFTKSVSFNIFVSIKNGIVTSIDMLKKIGILFVNLFKTGEVTKNLSSPIRLVYDIGNSINSIYINTNFIITLEAFFNIIASVSLTLGFINLLPIPVLDGGQILFNIITFIKKSPINNSFIYGYQTIGIIIILILFTLGISNDIFYFGEL